MDVNTAIIAPRLVAADCGHRLDQSDPDADRMCDGCYAAYDDETRFICTAGCNFELCGSCHADGCPSAAFPSCRCSVMHAIPGLIHAELPNAQRCTTRRVRATRRAWRRCWRRALMSSPMILAGTLCVRVCVAVAGLTLQGQRRVQSGALLRGRMASALVSMLHCVPDGSLFAVVWRSMAVCLRRRRTALHLASYYGHTETAKALVAAGADVHRRNNDGYGRRFRCVAGAV